MQNRTAFGCVKHQYLNKIIKLLGACFRVAKAFKPINGKIKVYESKAILKNITGQLVRKLSPRFFSLQTVYCFQSSFKVFTFRFQYGFKRTISTSNSLSLSIGKAPESRTWFLDPAKEGDLINRIQQQSCQAFQELDLQDFGLFDFRVDREGNPFFLECNLFCSFGSKSVVNVIAKDSGFTDESLFDLMVQNALLRKEKTF